MTSLAEVGAALAQRSRENQGLPRHVDEPSVITLVGRVLRSATASTVPVGVRRSAGTVEGVAEAHRNLQTADKRTPAAPPAGSTPTTPTGPADAPARARRKKAAGGQRRQETA